MRNRFAYFVSIAAVLAGLYVVPLTVHAADASISPYRVKSVTQDQEMTNAFRSDVRFAGADGACSIPLDEKNTLWLFGDTFIRKYAAPKGQPKPTEKQVAFINNSAALQNIDSKEMKFWWRNSARGPKSLLEPISKVKSYEWPGDGFVVDEKLFILNKIIVPNVSSGKNPGNLSFDWVGDEITRVQNPGESPDKWSCNSSPFQLNSAPIHVGTASLQKPDYIYFYTSLKTRASGVHPHPTGVARVPVKELLLNLGTNDVTYWDGANWSSDWQKSEIVFEDGASEMTVTELDGEPYLVATYIAPLTADVRMRFATNPQGPWSSPINVYHCPEHKVTVLGQACSVYSAKAHPEFSNKKLEVVVSYCSNPGDFKHFQARPDLYYPRVIRVDLSRP